MCCTRHSKKPVRLVVFGPSIKLDNYIMFTGIHSSCLRSNSFSTASLSNISHASAVFSKATNLKNILFWQIAPRGQQASPPSIINSRQQPGLKAELCLKAELGLKAELQFWWNQTKPIPVSLTSLCPSIIRLLHSFLLMEAIQSRKMHKISTGRV